MAPWIEIGVLPSFHPSSVRWIQDYGIPFAQQCDSGIVSAEDAGVFFRAYYHPLTNMACAHIDASSISESSHSNYAAQSPLGRFEPTKTFSNNNNRTVSFRVELAATGAGASTAGEAAKKEVRGPALWLNALTLPSFYESRPLPPPFVFLRVGSVLSIGGIVTACNIEWGGGLQVGEGPLGGNDVQYMSASVDVTVTSCALSYADQFNGPYRGQRGG